MSKLTNVIAGLTDEALVQKINEAFNEGADKRTYDALLDEAHHRPSVRLGGEGVEFAYLAD